MTGATGDAGEIDDGGTSAPGTTASLSPRGSVATGPTGVSPSTRTVLNELRSC